MRTEIRNVDDMIEVRLSEKGQEVRSLVSSMHLVGPKVAVLELLLREKLAAAG